MDCTISVFEAHYERAVAIRQSRMMDNGTAALYAQASQIGMTRIWNSWTQIIHKVTHAMNIRYGVKIGKGSTITWNGEAVDREGLIANFLRMFGRRSVEK